MGSTAPDFEVHALQHFPNLRYHAKTCTDCKQRPAQSVADLVACGRRELAGLYARLERIVGAN